ncbi:MAG: hypothetical protein WBG54_07160 [Acidobacteriaceae bacterium]
MRIPTLFRNLSLGLATATFAFAGAAFAQPSASAQNGVMEPAQHWHLVGATVRLDHALSTKSARQGQMVEAKLNGSVKTPDGVDLPKGAELIGRVDRVQASQSGGPAMLSLVFTKAEMKDGKTVPVKVTVIGAYPSDEAALAVNGDQTMGSAPRHVNSRARVDQEAGLLSHVSMHSAVQNHNSARFEKRDGDFTLKAGTYLQVAIAPRPANPTMNQGA